jgi:hypothetical protein
MGEVQELAKLWRNHVAVPQEQDAKRDKGNCILDLIFIEDMAGSLTEVVPIVCTDSPRR